ncbi:MAG: acyltransferase family protein [Acidobacteriota bacterium]
MIANTGNDRYHGLDALRASMMLLGIFIHTACAYSNLPDTWWYYDQRRSAFYDFSVLFIHLFRMPVFYVMAGFFGALLYGRRGPLGFMRNRAMRVVVPLLGGMLILFPPMQFLGSVSWHLRHGDTDPLAGAVEFIGSGRFLERIFPMHLWFLQYLVYLSIAALMAMPILESPVARRFREASGAWFRRAVLSDWRAVVFALPTLATMCLLKYGILEAPQDLAPDGQNLLAYGVFYFFGWALYAHRDLLAELRQGAWTAMAAGVAASGANAWFAAGQLAILPATNTPLILGTAATGALACWFLIFGFIGLFLRYLSRPSVVFRYLSDSAYWLYLIHPPLLVVLQMAVGAMPWSAHLKAAFVLLAATPLLLLSYHFLVRPTWLGALLNGRRHNPGTVPSVPGFRRLAWDDSPGGRAHAASWPHRR